MKYLANTTTIYLPKKLEERINDLDFGTRLSSVGFGLIDFKSSMIKKMNLH